MLDTNVLISGIFFGGPPGRVLEAWGTGKFELVLSPEILDEYREVGRELEGRYPARSTALAPVLALLTMNATLVAAAPVARGVCQDPDDDKFLSAAVAAGAEVIISGDRHLLAASGWQGIVVLTPRQFLDRGLAHREPPGGSRTK